MSGLPRMIVMRAREDYPHFIHSGEFEKLAMIAGYKGSTADRACRLLQKHGWLEGGENERGHKTYKFIPQPSMSSEEILRRSVR